jgi:hypothetical protein
MIPLKMYHPDQKTVIPPNLPLTPDLPQMCIIWQMSHVIRRLTPYPRRKCMP